MPPHLGKSSCDTLVFEPIATSLSLMLSYVVANFQVAVEWFLLKGPPLETLQQKEFAQNQDWRVYVHEHGHHTLITNTDTDSALSCEFKIVSSSEFVSSGPLPHDDASPASHYLVELKTGCDYYAALDGNLNLY